MADLPPHLVSSMQSLLLEACRHGYEAGMQAGAQRMRSAILNAAQAPFDQPLDLPEPETRAAALIGKLEGMRAPHGSVRKAIQVALRAAPNGLNEVEVGAGANAANPLVSARSVGGELRRMRDRLYRFNGGRWFLIVQKDNKETAEPEGSAEFQPHASKEASDDSETAIAA